MNGHPGGEEHTRRMLALSGLQNGARILDMGAGAGEAVALLRSLDYDAVGIDLEPRSALVQKGDMLHTGFASGSFDAVVSQCAFYISGDVPGALREAKRLLRPGGTLMLSDVFVEDPAEQIEQAGFTLVCQEDMTALWRAYYLEALWRGEADGCVGRGKCGYWLLICTKE